MRSERYFAFVDLCGFTRFTDFHGDEVAVEVLTRFRHAVREVATDVGIRVDKWLGDGAMFVGSLAHLVDAVLALEVRADELAVELPLRAGIAGGPVILLEGDDYVGGAVNLAARLCAVARPREILADASVAPLLPPSATAIPAGLRDLPGFLAPVEVVTIEPARRRARRVPAA